MSDKYEIKVDGEFHQFEGGGIRYTKDGKGRFDLIPADALVTFINFVEYQLEVTPHINRLRDTAHLIVNYANRDFKNAILGVTLRKYCIDSDEIGKNEVWNAVVVMLKDLAIHFQKGAEKYGENNWKKGIPQWSFEDSGFRHLCQYLNDETDEPHWISSIWNMMCWLQLELDNISIDVGHHTNIE